MNDEPGGNRLARWFRDPGHTAAVVAVTLFVGLVGGGTVVSVTGNSGKPESVTSTVTTTVTEAADSVQPQPEEASSIGLEELNEEEDVEFEVSAEFGNRNIGGKSYNNAVTGAVYSDGSGFPQLKILTGGRFSSIHFVVGIDADAECSQASANVSIEDEGGRLLWGPKQVGIREPISRTLSIPAPLQVILVQRSTGTTSSCNAGEAQVSWGGVEFREG
jgi:hypothetical protein